MKILFVPGSSGGHIFPALGSMDYLQRNVGDLDLMVFAIRGKIPNKILEDKFHTAITWVDSRASKLLTIFAVSAKSLFVLHRFKPDVVAAYGGFISLIVAFQARLLRIPVIIHEQNVKLGRANRIALIFANRLALSFTDSKDYISAKFAKKIIFTGNPLRGDLKKMDRNASLSRFGLKDKFTIAVMGGSQGSQRINRVFIQAVACLKQSLDFQVIHICGENAYLRLSQEYPDSKIDFRLYSFLNEINFAYNAADLVISRAGATSIAEICALGKPSILIPYPYAERHQEYNACVMRKSDAAIVIADNELTPQVLGRTILDLAKAPQRLNDLGVNAFKLAQPNAAENLANAILGLRLPR